MEKKALLVCCYTKLGGLSVEVIVIKVTCEETSLIISLDLAHHDFDQEKRVKDHAATANMFHDVTDEFNIILDEFGDLGGAYTI